MKNLFIIALTVIFLLYLLYAGYFYLYQRTFLFPRHLITPPGPVPAMPGMEQMWLGTSTGKVEAWYLAPLVGETNAPAPLLIVAHGNADLIDRWLPGFAASDPFNNLAVVKNHTHPVLIVHGKRDLTIAYHHGVDLYKAAQQGELVSLDCGHAGCIDDWGHFWHELVPFFAKTGFLTANVDKAP